MDDRKTVTRRAIKPQPMNIGEGVFKYKTEYLGCINAILHNAPYQPGDILYVRETWFRTNQFGLQDGYIYKAAITDQQILNLNTFGVCIKWHPSIHMPKEAARIFLRVADVRVERLQEITEDQAKKEGCSDYTSTALGFCCIWDSTIKNQDLDKYGWDANPWVFVISFERISEEKGCLQEGMFSQP